ncbi:M12 family metallopeptidase [Stenotrophomonas maltophilia]|uniref:M12 family metallopeptidase n=1 Tax=Stenotrophomonas maltophilia TaxID=40324 RepID=UPI00387685C4
MKPTHALRKSLFPSRLRGIARYSALMLLFPAAGAMASEATSLRQVVYQGKQIVAEVSDGVVFLQDDVLAFPGEVTSIGDVVTHAHSDHAIDEPQVGTARLWRKSNLTYAFQSAVPSSVRNLLRQGAGIWNEATSWQFTETANVNSADIVVANSASRCAASVGAPADGDQATMTLSTDCTLRSMVHELGHVVGMIHEHQRPGRDRWVRVRQDTLDYIKQNYPASTYNLVIAALRPEHFSPGQPYAMDTGSIMMYGSYPQRSPMKEDLMERNLPFFTAPDGSLYEASPARLSNKDIATAEYLATLITRVNSLLLHY